MSVNKDVPFFKKKKNPTHCSCFISRLIKSCCQFQCAPKSASSFFAELFCVECFDLRGETPCGFNSSCLYLLPSVSGVKADQGDLD